MDRLQLAAFEVRCDGSSLPACCGDCRTRWEPGGMQFMFRLDDPMFGTLVREHSHRSHAPKPLSNRSSRERRNLRGVMIPSGRTTYRVAREAAWPIVPISTAISTGLGRYATAPAFIAAARVRSSWQDVTNTIAGGFGSAASSACNSIPLRPGMSTSRRMQQTFPRHDSERNSSAD